MRGKKKLKKNEKGKGKGQARRETSEGIRTREGFPNEIGDSGGKGVRERRGKRRGRDRMRVEISRKYQDIRTGRNGEDGPRRCDEEVLGRPLSPSVACARRLSIL